MRHGITSLLVVGCVSSAALAFHSRSAGAAVGQACELLTRDLVMKVSPDSRKKTLEREKPIDDPFAKDLQAAGQPVTLGMSCKYGPVMIVLDPLAQPAQARNALQARTRPYEASSRSRASATRRSFAPIARRRACMSGLAPIIS